MTYVRNPVAGGDPYIQNELLKLEALFSDFKIDSIRLTIHYSEPSKPEEGHIYAADGTNWNPGSGKGPYVYVGDEWLPMFLISGHKVTKRSLKLVGKPPIFRNTGQKVSPPKKGLTFTTYAPKTG